jgi:uncharacterized protein (TIGR00297 family)
MTWAEHGVSGAGLATACVVGVAMGAVSYRARVLDVGGALGFIGIAVLVLVVSGTRREWVAPLATFFVLASGLTKVLGRSRIRFEQDDSRRGRTIAQVVANGGPATLCLLGAVLFPHAFWYPAYLGALAAVNADTWATEIGTRWGGPPCNLVSWRRVPVGQSGGVTAAGTMGAAAGALIIAVCGAAVGGARGGTYAILGPALAGSVGALFDSLLGATVQALYRCERCGRLTERTRHCHFPTRLHSGLAMLNTHWVNFLCGASGAGVAALLALAT